MSYQSIYFTEKELACKHCGLMGCTDELKQALDDYRELVHNPVVINDAFRCAQHNLDVGGVPHSEHPRGEAADINVPGFSLQQMYDAAKEIPAFMNGGIGVYSGAFIHVDVRQREARWAQVIREGRRIYVGLEESQLVRA